jgi:hypothetical protein
MVRALPETPVRPFLFEKTIPVEQDVDTTIETKKAHAINDTYFTFS